LAGSDDLLGGEGKDWVLGGNDVLAVDNKPAARDVLTCGGGFDRVAADTKDVVAADCEEVVIIRTAAQDEAFFGPIFESFLEGLAPPPIG
jgi:hypothetical protein